MGGCSNSGCDHGKSAQSLILSKGFVSIPKRRDGSSKNSHGHPRSHRFRGPARPPPPPYWDTMAKWGLLASRPLAVSALVAAKPCSFLSQSMLCQQKRRGHCEEKSLLLGDTFGTTVEIMAKVQQGNGSEHFPDLQPFLFDFKGRPLQTS